VLAVFVFTALLNACGPQLQHAGYAAPNKVWYHWVKNQRQHLLVICDVQPDGSETNCKESDI